jgi:CHAT domain-containing protein/Tfp pilus assembly protein PilF
LEKMAAPNDSLVATTLEKLAQIYRAQARYAEAEPLFKRSLAIREKVLGPDHPEVGQSFDNLAALYRIQARYAEAEPLVKRALVIREKALGSNHPDVGRSLNSLAELYRVQGRYVDALTLYNRSLVIFEKSLGPDHPLVATVLNNLALLYMNQGRYADAEPLYKRSLAIRERVLGPDHPDVAQSLNNLAELYKEQGRYADAEPLLKRSLAIREKAFGSIHPDVAQSLNNLAELYKEQGRYADAEPLLKRSLAIRERALGADHPDVGQGLDHLAELYTTQGRYADAEPLYRRSLAILEKLLGPDHPDVAKALNNLALLYSDQHRYGDALPLVRRTIALKAAATGVALPVLFGAQAEKLVLHDEALDDSLILVQRASQTSASEALNALALRFSAGDTPLAQVVRSDQDLANEAASLDKAIIAAVSTDPSKRDAAAEQRIRDRIAAIERERDDLAKLLVQEFPDYAALSNPQPLMVKDIQPLLADDEALIVINLGAKTSYVWAITRSAADWKELAVTATDISKAVSQLRALLDFDNIKPFDAHASFELYQKILAPVERLSSAKARLSFVVNGALTSLPPQLLVTRDPAGKALKDVEWLVRTHAVTVLPSLASLKVFRGKSAATHAEKPLIGFANPVFNRDQQQLHAVRGDQGPQAPANVGGTPGRVADLAELRWALPPLPETADELMKVATSVKADPADIFLGARATVTRVKQTKLDQYRIVYFSTHSLLASEVAEFAKFNPEPALVLSLPDRPTEFDDGLLTASEVAQLKLNADWVVLSGADTGAGDKPGGEALSGLVRAFFYAGARSVVASYWGVETQSAAAFMVGTFSAFAADPKLSHAEALQKSILAMIGDAQHPEWADPKFWAPFFVVGEPAKPGN